MDTLIEQTQRKLDHDDEIIEIENACLKAENEAALLKECIDNEATLLKERTENEAALLKARTDKDNEAVLIKAW